jgi:hypothetical protein
MTITADAPGNVYMAMDDILQLWSVDAIAEHEYRTEGLSHESGIVIDGLRVSDVIVLKAWDIDHDVKYGALRASMVTSGQTVPIAVNAGHLINGGHRVALALELGWPGMETTADFEASTDRDFDQEA